MKTLIVFLYVKLTILLSLLLTGCATGILKHGAFGSGQKTNSSPKQEEKICENGGKCEYVTTKTIAEYPEFLKDCQAKKKKPDKCAADFNEMLVARLWVAYPRADFDYAVMWCKSEPMKCGLDTIEKANNLEDAIFETQEKRDFAYVEQKREEQRQRTAAAIAAFGRGMQQASQQQQPYMIKPVQQPYIVQPLQAPQNTNCTSTRIGDTVHTNCR